MKNAPYFYLMEKQFEIIRKTRQSLLNTIADLTIDQLNEVPAGFNNNIIWNLGHLVAAQQGLCYTRGGHQMHIEDSFFQSYKPDTKPQGYISEPEVEKIKQLFTSTIDQTEEDCKNNKFEPYKSWTTRSGIVANNIKDAIGFVVFHEGFHTGYIQALRHCIKK